MFQMISLLTGGQAQHGMEYVAPAVFAIMEPMWAWMKNFLQGVQALPGYNTQRMREESVFITLDISGPIRPLSRSGIYQGLSQLWSTIHQNPQRHKLL